VGIWVTCGRFLWKVPTYSILCVGQYFTNECIWRRFFVYWIHILWILNHENDIFKNMEVFIS
jgi:hypothetical protein